MKLSEFYKSTIIEVRADFGFSDFNCDHEELTIKIGITPDEIYRKGNEVKLKTGKKRNIINNGWYISSHSKSKDINEHLRYLLRN